MAKKGFYKDYDLNQLWEQKDLDTLYLCCENAIMDTFKKYPNLKNYQEDDKLELGYISFMKAVHHFDPSKNKAFLTLLCVILNNEILMEFRKQRTKDKYIMDIGLNDIKYESENGSGVEIHETISSGVDIEQDYINKAMSQYYLDAAKEKLSEIQYEIFRLMIEGKKQDKIANEVGLSQAQISRVQKKIKQILKNADKEKERKTNMRTSAKRKSINKEALESEAVCLAPQDKYVKTPEKKSLLKTMIVGEETGYVYDNDKDNIYIQIEGVKVTIPHDKVDAFVEELCEFVENI